MKNGKKVIALSAIAILMLGSSAYAGKIITDADVSNIDVVENEQFGFGGWNYDNVHVRIVNLSDFSGNVGTFNTLDGTYTPMGADMSFESDIKNAEGIVMGHLHGKDWPVGEPSGIKVINGDTKTSHGKPVNCIMTSSYQAYQVDGDETSGSGYLDAFADGLMPKPVICSSPWQTHKRYKINLLPTTVETVGAEGGYGQPVDLVFNLDPTDVSTGITRYQLLQKANNYTGKRLDGYKVEVLDANGLKNPALTLSLGQGEGLDHDTNLPDGSDIWGEADMANMSHGLWGPYEEGRFENGFFDFETAYYKVALDDTNQTISYVGDMLGGNYQALFGNWLPSIWEPMGIFHDDDQDPETDGALKAFNGVAPGYAVRDWYKSVIKFDPETPNVAPVYAWLPATDEELAEWEGEWYEEGPVEDVLNLGLNYIIEIGENAAIGSTFILRITPHVAVDQTPPSSYLPDPGTQEGTADFNGDGNADILWKNALTNKVSIWYMNADSTYTETEVGTVTSDLSIEGTGNFNDDSRADILWKDALTNKVSIWYMNADGTYVESEVGTVTSDLNIESTGDFNADGTTDILWRNTATQEISFWYMSSDGVVTDTPLYTTAKSWIIETVGDFDGNGASDILWRSSKNSIDITYMNAEGVLEEKHLYTTSKKWLIAAAADFDANGVDDILWRHASTDEVAITYMNEDKTFTDETLYFTGSTWNIDAAADFDNNGFADILWSSNPSIGTSSEIDITYMSDVDPREEVIATINK